MSYDEIDRMIDEMISGENAKEMYSVTPATYTCKNGYVMKMHLVVFNFDMSAREQKIAESEAKWFRGWYDKSKGGYMMRKESDINDFTNSLMRKGIL